jgi:hypothetical protein
MTKEIIKKLKEFINIIETYKGKKNARGTLCREHGLRPSTPHTPLQEKPPILFWCF